MIRIRESIKNKNKNSINEDLMKRGSWGPYTYEWNYLVDSYDGKYVFHVGVDTSREDSQVVVTIDPLMTGRTEQYYRDHFDLPEQAKAIGERISKVIKTESVGKIRSIVNKLDFRKM